MQKYTAPSRSLRGPSPASGGAKNAGAPDRDAPNAKIKCVITRACRACFSSNAGVRWRLRLRHPHHAPTYQRSIASVARLLRGDGRDRPGSIRAVVVHGIITGTYKHSNFVVEASIRKRWGARPRRPECKDKVRYYPGVPGLFWLKRRWALGFEVAASPPCANAPAH